MLAPEFTPVTTPALDIVATAGVAEVHGFTAAGVPEPVNVVVEFLQIVKVPLMVGCASTVIDTVLLHPLLLV
jgi:hypothetical protein